MLIYMAHPVRPIEGETLAGNIERARARLRWCHERFPAWVVIAPWLAEIEAYGVTEDGERAQRAAGMARNLEVTRRCDGILLVGGRVSAGMRAELKAAMHAGKRVFDLTWPARRSTPLPCAHPHEAKKSGFVVHEWDVTHLKYGDWPEDFR